LHRGIAALLLLALIAPRPALAEWDVDGIEELIPHRETELERRRLQERGQSPIVPGVTADPAPLPPVRNCAEWEPVTGVLVRYPLGLPYSLLLDLQQKVTLHVVVTSGSYGSARINMAVAGVDTAAVVWLKKPNDSIWIRDYGPWFVFDGNGDQLIVDHVYNRPQRPNDDLIPVEFGAQQGIPVVRHDMWHTGGNYMTDGASFSMSTDLVYGEAQSANSMSPAQVDQLMADYYGVAAYDVVQDIETGGIHHIDTWGKFLDEETVLIKEVWPAHATWDDLEQRAALIGSLPASTGRNYRVFRVYCQDIGGGAPASYTNSLIVNDGIYMPAFGNPAADSAAAGAFRAAAPGYDVRAYAYPGWLTDDALHCRTKGVMDRGMLRVAHVPVREARTGAVPIVATVDDRSEAGIASVDLHYRFAGGSWVTAAMTAAGGDDYQGEIPAPGAATTVDYYVQAADHSGRAEGMPRVAPAAWYTFPIEPAATGADAVAGAEAGAASAYPNPFRESTRFAFELRFPGRVRLDVIDVAGRRVRALEDGVRGGGSHAIEWDGRDESGRPVAAGVYFFRLRAAGISYTRPVVRGSSG
jgi:agmatine/peptidylarginine deiminase